MRAEVLRHRRIAPIGISTISSPKIALNANFYVSPLAANTETTKDVTRADQIEGFTEGSPEEAKFKAIAAALEAYEAKRWPDGKAPGGKGLAQIVAQRVSPPGPPDFRKAAFWRLDPMRPSSVGSSPDPGRLGSRVAQRVASPVGTYPRSGGEPSCLRHPKATSGGGYWRMRWQPQPRPRPPSLKSQAIARAGLPPRQPSRRHGWRHHDVPDDRQQPTPRSAALG